MRLGRIFLCLILSAASAQAGVVVFKNGGVLVTTQQSVSGSELSVSLPGGSATFLLDDVSWHSSSAATLYAGAQAALAEGKSDVALILAKESVAREPATSNEARQMVFELQDKLAPPAPAPAAVPGFTPATPGGVAPAAPSGSTAVDQMVPGAAPAPGPAAVPAATGPAPEIDKVHGWPIQSSAIGAEDLRINAIVAGIFGLIVLFSLWKMTVSD